MENIYNWNFWKSYNKEGDLKICKEHVMNIYIYIKKHYFLYEDATSQQERPHFTSPNATTCCSHYKLVDEGMTLLCSARRLSKKIE